MYKPASPSCCFQISALDGDGTTLLPSILGLKDIGVRNTILSSINGVLGVVCDRVILVGVWGVDFRGVETSFGTFSAVIGVLVERRTLLLGVSGVLGVLGV